MTVDAVVVGAGFAGCTDTNYFETFNRPNVELIIVRKTPIESIDATGITTADAHFDVDDICASVAAAGYTGFELIDAP